MGEPGDENQQGSCCCGCRCIILCTAAYSSQYACWAFWRVNSFTYRVVEVKLSYLSGCLVDFDPVQYGLVVHDPCRLPNWRGVPGPAYAAAVAEL